jgi:hypothetical protein
MPTMAYGVENRALFVPHHADARRPGFDRGEAFLFSRPAWLVFCGRMCVFRCTPRIGICLLELIRN